VVHYTHSNELCQALFSIFAWIFYRPKIFGR